MLFFFRVLFGLVCCVLLGFVFVFLRCFVLVVFAFMGFLCGVCGLCVFLLWLVGGCMRFGLVVSLFFVVGFALYLVCFLLCFV